MTIDLKPGERLDDLQRNHYRIIQNKETFCFGMDAVLLSGFARVRPGEKVLDLGTGTGIIPILLAAKTQADHLTGLEIQPESVDMARRSVKLNGLEDRVNIIEGDIKEASDLLGKGMFDVVTSNPPYMIANHGLTGERQQKAIARHEILCTFEDVARETSRVLAPEGKLYLVHRPFRLAEIIRTLTDYGLEPKRMRLVHPFVEKEPNMVLLEARKGGNSRMRVEPPLIVFREPGIYSQEIYDTYGY